MLQTAKKKRRKRKPTPKRHRWFDHWLIAKGEPLKRLVEGVVAAVEAKEQRVKARRRARRPLDQELHLARIEAVVANLAYAVLNPPQTGRLAVNMRHGEKGRSRYENPALGKPFSSLLYLLEEMKLLTIKQPKVIRGEVRSIIPTRAFRRMVVNSGITFADFGRHESEEIVLLTRNARQGTNGERIRERIDYSDTLRTRRVRQELRRINAFLRNADITFIEDGEHPLVDPYQRELRRHFVLLADQKMARFDQGGRLFGGFWQNIKSSRRAGIRIDGEPTVALDYSSMFTRLAYAEIGVPSPLGDLYAVPGFEGYRSGIKMAMNCLLFDTGPRRSWPAEMGIGVGNDEHARRHPRSKAARYEALLPSGSTVRKTKEAILRLHPHLKPAWGRGLGYRLMYQESEILMAILRELMRRGIPALGLHDGLLVARSRGLMAKRVMEEIAKKFTGHRIPVGIKAE